MMLLCETSVIPPMVGVDTESMHGDLLLRVIMNTSLHPTLFMHTMLLRRDIAAFTPSCCKFVTNMRAHKEIVWVLMLVTEVFFVKVSSVIKGHIYLSYIK